MHTYEIEVEREDRWYIIRVPEIDQLTQARHAGEIELMARELGAGHLLNQAVLVVQRKCRSAGWSCWLPKAVASSTAD